MRTGVIARKIGMSRVFQDDGGHVPVTVLKVDGCQVVAQRTRETHGYDAVQLGAGTAKVKNVSKAMRGHFAKAQVEPKRKLGEFHVSADNMVDVGAEVVAGHFVAGQFVDVSGISIGKGLPVSSSGTTLAAWRRATAFPSLTGPTVRPDNARTRARYSKARRWRAILVPKE